MNYIIVFLSWINLFLTDFIDWLGPIIHAVKEGIGDLASLLGSISTVKNWLKVLAAIGPVRSFLSAFVKAFREVRDSVFPESDKDKPRTIPVNLGKAAVFVTEGLGLGIIRGVLSALFFWPFFLAGIVNVAAGVDPITLRSCPWSEKFKITRVSVWLIVSSGFVFLLNYHAFATILGEREAPIVAAMISFTFFMFDSNLIGWSYYIDGVFAYTKSPSQYTSLGENVNFTDYTDTIMHSIARQRFWRIFISAGIALVIGVFVLMDIYKESISNAHRQSFVRHNKQYMDEYNDIPIRIDNNIKLQQDIIDNLREREKEIILEISPKEGRSSNSFENDVVIIELKGDIENLEKHITSLKSKSDEDRENAGRQERGEIPPYIAKCDVRCNSLRTEADSLDDEIKSEESKKLSVETRIQTRLSQLAEDERNSLAAADSASKQKLEMQNNNLNDIREEIKRRENELAELKGNRTSSIAAERTSLNSSPLGMSEKEDFYTRWFGFLSLFVQGDFISDQFGSFIGMSIFSAAVLVFIMLIEMLPVIAKMFFSYETQYGLRLYLEYQEGRSKITPMLHVNILRNLIHARGEARKISEPGISEQEKDTDRERSLRDKFEQKTKELVETDKDEAESG
jgi:hypothetical protein